MQDINTSYLEDTMLFGLQTTIDQKAFIDQLIYTIEQADG